MYLKPYLRLTDLPIDMDIETFSLPVSASIGSVSAELLTPSSVRAVMTLAHGAGADMNHSFMKALSKGLAETGIATLRFNFPYIERGKKMPDPPAVAEKTVSVAMQKAHELLPAVPLLAAGKSFGGRMTSQLVSKQVPSFLKGIVFYGFPLHPAGKPSTERAAHLAQVTVPMLFLQGTKDALAYMELVSDVAKKLPLATLQAFEGADHSFKAGKKDLVPDLSLKTLAWFESL